MCTNISYLYEDYKKGELILDPFYQRGLVWKLKQKQSFIENLFKHKALIAPTIILNWVKDGKEVIDGKQRITTVFDFLENKFKLSNGMYFKDLCRKDSDFISCHEVRYTRIEKIGHSDLTDNEKIELFLEINELGTKMSDKHIEKVKELIK